MWHSNSKIGIKLENSNFQQLSAEALRFTLCLEQIIQNFFTLNEQNHRSQYPRTIYHVYFWKKENLNIAVLSLEGGGRGREKGVRERSLCVGGCRKGELFVLVS